MMAETVEVRGVLVLVVSCSECGESDHDRIRHIGGNIVCTCINGHSWALERVLPVPSDHDLSDVLGVLTPRPLRPE